MRDNIDEKNFSETKLFSGLFAIHLQLMTNFYQKLIIYYQIFQNLMESKEKIYYTRYMNLF